MKTIKQILESHNIKEDTLYHNYSYLYESIAKAMEEFGRQSFDYGFTNGVFAGYGDAYEDYDDYLNALNDEEN